MHEDLVAPLSGLDEAEAAVIVPRFELSVESHGVR
jgi:hypothetical protein